MQQAIELSFRETTACRLDTLELHFINGEDPGSSSKDFDRFLADRIKNKPPNPPLHL
jgi:hypothetical protein